jgi:hypothetical protein
MKVIKNLAGIFIGVMAFISILYLVLIDNVELLCIVWIMAAFNYFRS